MKRDLYAFGDFVVYEAGYKEPEVGRFVEYRGCNGMVCFGTGCTAASTPLEMLRRATDEEVFKANAMIGYHRFDTKCDDYNPNYCYSSCGKRFSNVDWD